MLLRINILKIQELNGILNYGFNEQHAKENPVPRLGGGLQLQTQKLAVMANTCNRDAWEVGIEESEVLSHPQLHSEF